MKFETAARWLARKWRPAENAQQLDELAEAYGLAFGTERGRAVLNDLFDNVYCTVWESGGALTLEEHNGQRKLVQMILLHLDKFEHPEKYQGEIAEEANYDPRVVNEPSNE